MDSATYLAHLDRELAAFRACLDGDLSAPVEHCGGWTLYDLADHLGDGNIWVAVAVAEGHGRHKGPPAPRERAALIEWFDGTCARLREAISGDPAAPAWTFYPPHTVGFWQRRRAQETLVHRWDAQHALGIARPLDTALAADGVAEVFDTMAPRMIARGAAQPPAHALRVRATDTGQTWTYGPGEPLASVEGSAQDLLLTLWGRHDHTLLTWDGDLDAGLTVLKGPLTP